jgi:hypothetical protein
MTNLQKMASYVLNMKVTIELNDFEHNDFECLLFEMESCSKGELIFKQRNGYIFGGWVGLGVISFDFKKDSMTYEIINYQPALITELVTIGLNITNFKDQ